MSTKSRYDIAITGHYRVRIADSEDDIERAQALRFQVFNLELNEGLESAYETKLDVDQYDSVCDHLIVETDTDEIVGTYRLQTGLKAKQEIGYYCEQEFHFQPYENIREEVIEAGRACIHQDHRSFSVLNMLWRGIGQYARVHNGRYLMGCSSLTSQDPAYGLAAYEKLRKHLPPEELQTNPKQDYLCIDDSTDPSPTPKIPKLLSAYLLLGSWICGPPALDRQFKTIDFLTLLDLESLTPKVAAKYLGL
jgi:putative hemolysin